MKAKKSQKQEDNLDCYHILALNNLLFTTSWALLIYKWDLYGSNNLVTLLSN